MEKGAAHAQEPEAGRRGARRGEAEASDSASAEAGRGGREAAAADAPSVTPSPEEVRKVRYVDRSARTDRGPGAFPSSVAGLRAGLVPPPSSCNVRATLIVRMVLNVLRLRAVPCAEPRQRA